MPAIHSFGQSSDGRPPYGAVLTLGHLELRLCRDTAELDEIQALRYQVFYDEMGARPDAAALESHRDRDRFDEFCEHLLVRDMNQGGRIIGTYRLLRQEVAEKNGGFYTAGEFDLAPLVEHGGRLLELGRSCVHRDYRSRPTLQLLWRGLATYMIHHDIDIMFGCASLPGTDPDRLATLLTFLHERYLAPEPIRARPVPGRHVDLLRMDPARLNPREALRLLPPLLKGYLRVGGVIGDGAVIDHQFNTTDVCIMVPRDNMPEKYRKHYERIYDAI